MKIRQRSKEVVPKDHSAGAVVYSRQPETGELKFLLICHLAGHWSFPKGHLEEGESSLEAAVREIREETGLTVELDSNFHEKSFYTTARFGPKLVDFYLAKSSDPESLYYQRSELKDACWLDFPAALKRLDFSRDKEILSAANEYLKNRV